MIVIDSAWNVCPFNHLDGDFDLICCLYNTAHSNIPNADLIKPNRFKTSKSHNKDIDPEKNLKATVVYII